MPEFLQNLLAGAMAGTAVDTALYPLDTVKTRLQSKAGFLASGGLAGTYKGLSSAIVGSAPSAALFFTTYEFVKHKLHHGDYSQGNIGNLPVTMIAAVSGEIMACLVRVPLEVVKQNMQANKYPTLVTAVSSIIRSYGIMGGLYRGFSTTLFREIPFTCIQFPIYESLKSLYYLHNYNNNQLESESKAPPASPLTFAVFGSFAGCIAAATTTPLDVVKTRIMLRETISSSSSSSSPALGTWSTLTAIARDEGLKSLFKGIVPRTCWIGIGGLIFFGVYEEAKFRLSYLSPFSSSA